MPEINMGFKTYNNKYYPNIRNIDFKSAEDIRNSLGAFINETIVDTKSIFGGSQTDTTGVYIYRSIFDEKKAFRIYKDWSNILFCNIEQHPSEAQMLSKLIEHQSKVKLTDFPISILSLKGYVIGQEIPFYHNSLTLEENIVKFTKTQIIEKYIEILTVLKELINNDIMYSDIHAKNFMIVDNVVKLIDFDPNNISFDYTQYNKMVNNIKFMINRINDYKGINYILKSEKTVNDIEETIKTKILK